MNVELSETIRLEGAIARGAGKKSYECPYEGQQARWWLEGYNNEPGMMAKVFAPGRPLGG